MVEVFEDYHHSSSSKKYFSECNKSKTFQKFHVHVIFLTWLVVPVREGRLSVNIFWSHDASLHYELSARLIVIMLFRLQMTIDDAIKAYTTFASRVFAEKKWFFQQGTFKSSLLEEAFLAIIQSGLKEGNPRMVRLLDEEGPKWYVMHEYPFNSHVYILIVYKFCLRYACEEYAFPDSFSYLDTCR